ncbi:hemin uptake protein HemP [Nitratireductor sp. XY-223]|uniref:hemin uptake protein HemP n=1 Tax=Nitratireductor sp. XY-223 TaxID=2561926 RepID=UPI001FEE4481|nr:hemin uptake protein HemP [Nitratireductor sp. XY-223]
MPEQTRESKSDRDGRSEAGKAAVKTLKSQDLFQGARELGIEHHGALYRLKITRQGKLILNK